MNKTPTEPVPEGALALFPPDNNKTINKYVDILISVGMEWGLLGPREPARIWSRHIINSVAVAEIIPQGRTVVDVGSGAGLPGIPLAIARPDLRVTLLDSLARRVKFMHQTVQELGLAERVQVVRSRAENHHQTYDVVVSRAVAHLDKLLGWCLPMIGMYGEVVALKGQSAEQEIADIHHKLSATGLRAEVHVLQPIPELDPTWAVRIFR